MRFPSEDHFLEQWRSVLEERTQQVTSLLSQVEGVCGIVLGGSLGGGEPWPLSDIDLIMICKDGQVEAAKEHAAQRRREILAGWEEEGFRTSLDFGRLVFSRSEALETVLADLPQATTYLADLRWFHSLDKAYRGRPVYDPSGVAGAITSWVTASRFRPDVVGYRIQHHGRAAGEHLRQMDELRDQDDHRGAAIHLYHGAIAALNYLLELWGVRDNSFVRLGTRFERAAEERSAAGLARRIMTLLGLDGSDISRRMEQFAALLDELRLN